MKVPRFLIFFRRPLLAVFGGLLLLSPLPAYYHFLHIRHDGDALRAIPERFDLRVLPDSAVPLLVSKSVEPEFADGDTWESLLSQVRLAASQWSSVPHSVFQLRFAGEVSEEPASGTPHVQVVFEELPPGVIAMAGPVARDTVTSDQNGEFVPITRSVVILSHRLRERPSYSEAFYLTLVHEMGHALGLQHTFSGSVMSTGVTRASTKATPLMDDDFAGLASLYPDAYFASDSGVIRGKVTVDGDPLHFANVTALKPSGAAVSTLTLPDGSYEIRGLRSGGYYVYAQAVPPSSQEGLGPGQISLPKDESNVTIPPGPTFATRFFPTAPDWHGAYTVEAQSGTVLNEINIDVSRVESRLLGDITTYSFPGNFAVNPAVINTNSERRFLVAYGANLVSEGTKANGLRVESTSAGISDDDVRAYDPAPDFLRVDLWFHPFIAAGPKPLLWSRAGEVFVQPAAFRLVSAQPPDVSETQLIAGENGQDEIRLRGAELAPSFTYLLDGMVADRLAREVSPGSGEMALRQPFTSDARPLRATVLSSDGQSSLYLNANPLTVQSRLASPVQMRASTTTVRAGEATRVVLEADGDPFAYGDLGVHFNSPHLVARGLWRDTANRLIVNIFAMPGAPNSKFPLMLRKDLAILQTGISFTISPADPSALRVDPRVVDESTGDAVIYPGSSALLRIDGQDVEDTLTVRLADRFVLASRIDGSVFRASVPADLPVGLTQLFVEQGDRQSAPIAVELASAPPAIREGQISGRRSSSGSSSRRPVELIVELPGVDPLQRETTPLKVRVDGATISSLERRLPEQFADQIHILFDITDRQPSSEVDPGAVRQVKVQIEWLGRNSAPLPLTIPNN